MSKDEYLERLDYLLSREESNQLTEAEKAQLDAVKAALEPKRSVAGQPYS